MFHRGRTFVRNRRRDHRRGDHYSLTAHLWSRRAGRKIDIHISLESISLHRFATDRTQLIVTRTFVDDGGVVVTDVGDVGGLINDRHVALRR